MPSQNEAAAPGQPETPPDGLEAVDPAIADALKAPKNRQTGASRFHYAEELTTGLCHGLEFSMCSVSAVLRFEEDVLAFIDSGEEAMFFPLTLSGYQVRNALLHCFISCIWAP